MSNPRYTESIRRMVERVLSEDTRSVATLELHQHMRMDSFNEHTVVDLIVAAYMAGFEKSEFSHAGVDGHADMV